MYQGKTQYLKRQVLLNARSWLGTRFRHQGRSKKNAKNPGGVDCIGLVVELSKEMGLTDGNGNNLKDFDKTNYSRTGVGDSLKKVLVEYFDIGDKNNIEVGDILLLKFMGQPQHVAIVGSIEGNLTMIHSYQPAEKVVEHYLTDKWISRVVDVFKFRGFD